MFFVFRFFRFLRRFIDYPRHMLPFFHFLAKFMNKVCNEEMIDVNKSMISVKLQIWFDTKKRWLFVHVSPSARCKNYNYHHHTIISITTKLQTFDISIPSIAFAMGFKSKRSDARKSEWSVGLRTVTRTHADNIVAETSPIAIPELDEAPIAVSTNAPIANQDIPDEAAPIAVSTDSGEAPIFISADLDESHLSKKRKRVGNEPSNAKNFRQDFKNLSDKWKRARTDDLMTALNKFVEDEGLTITETLGYLLHRANYEKDKRAAALGMRIYNGQIASVENSFDLDAAIAIQHSFAFSREQMRFMKKVMESKGVHFPNTTDLEKARAALRPVIKPVLEGKGVTVSYEHCVKKTMESVIEVVHLLGQDISEGDKCTMYFNDGCDGGEQQVVWKSKVTKYNEENIFQYNIMPLSFICINHVL